MATIQKTISPIDQSVVIERQLASSEEANAAIDRALLAQKKWQQTSLAERGKLLHKLVDAMLAKKDLAARELTLQMGRPISHSPGELDGFEERARYMIDVAEEALKPVQVGEKAGFTRYIRRDPLGLVFVIAPWNYPYLTAVNSVVPALMAGNAVLLKHSAQTPTVSENFVAAGLEAGLPEGLFQFLHLSHSAVADIIGDARVNYVAFTGSVDGGHAVQKAAANKFIACGLELGGKDPAYVRSDADLKHAVETLVDGAFFNAGQSCCGIERIYVHGDVYEKFVADYVEKVKQYKLGDPMDPETNIGPVVKLGAAHFIEAQVDQALKAGATALINPALFPAAKRGSCYMAPQVLVDVDHNMSVMKDETFGPVVGIMKVGDDDEAIKLMNDSPYGLTAAVFTKDEEAAIRIGDQVETGTWFMNRCDYLDPALAWTGVKDTGRGITLSSLGYEHLTRAKSYHLKTQL